MNRVTNEAYLQERKDCDRSAEYSRELGGGVSKWKERYSLCICANEKDRERGKSGVPSCALRLRHADNPSAEVAQARRRNRCAYHRDRRSGAAAITAERAETTGLAMITNRIDNSVRKRWWVPNLLAVIVSLSHRPGYWLVSRCYRPLARWFKFVTSSTSSLHKGFSRGGRLLHAIIEPTEAKDVL